MKTSAQLPGKLQLPQPVWFECRSRKAHEVALVGRFGPWPGVPLPMAPNGHGRWIRVLFLTPGRYEYHYLIDGQIADRPRANGTAHNKNGDMNWVLMVRPRNRGAAARQPARKVALT
jgi:hypothetical protein